MDVALVLRGVAAGPVHLADEETVGVDVAGLIDSSDILLFGVVCNTIADVRFEYNLPQRIAIAIPSSDRKRDRADIILNRERTPL
ncbi:MAG: hypothetical protein ACPL7O_12335 [Armatimonadota bacterium]